MCLVHFISAVQLGIIAIFLCRKNEKNEKSGQKNDLVQKMPYQRKKGEQLLV